MTSPKQLVECVINISEGRDAAVLATITATIDEHPGCALLHRDVGHAAHRAVFTFAGQIEAVFSVAYLVYKASAELIDMRHHQGTHPRMGAVDVCPFVPIAGVTMKEVVARTRVLAKRLGEELDLPVYLYDSSATAGHRRNLADVRRGEYEGLARKITDPDWRPDYGPIHNERFGATALGARPFLIAWNINLSPTTTLAVAKRVARQLRASGYRGTPGLFPGLKAIGWHLADLGRCQISCNVVAPDTTDLGRVYLTAVNLVAELGGTVTGSELIGLIPEKHLRGAGKAFCFTDDPEEELRAAIDILGLADLRPFDLNERVLDRTLVTKLGT